jgi:UDP-N-acetylmuramate dehydrogenase
MTLDVQQNLPLKPYTTFKIGGPARYFCAVTAGGEIREAVALARSESLPLFVLGGGSNILVSDAGFHGIVLHPARNGIEVLEQTVSQQGRPGVRLRISAGEPWDSLVAYTVDHGWWGIENLSHIPGQSGAALVQNIGAYGQQLSDVFEEAEVLSLADCELDTLSAAECGLAYRRSIFNSTRRGEFLIWSITLTLGLKPQVHIGYRDVQAYFADRGNDQPSQSEIREAVIQIRDRKFPYPRQERGGNAGSFFKNPTLDSKGWPSLAARVRARFGDAAHDRLLASIARSRPEAGGQSGSDSVRIPAALLIDLCGLKGFEAGRAQVNPSQPLVILNQGGATAGDVLRVAGHVRQTIYRETGVVFELEPELIGFSPQEIDLYLGL